MYPPTILHEQRTAGLPLTSEYQKSWALRYLREAKSELHAIHQIPYMAPSLIVEALKKAQAAIYYSLGEPSFIAPIVKDNVYSSQPPQNPALKFLVELEKTVQQMEQTQNWDRREALEQVTYIIQLASEIVELFTGEDE